MSQKSFISQSSCEENDLIDYDYFAKDEKQPLRPLNTEYFYQEYPYHRPTESDFERREIEGSKLFDKTKRAKREESRIENVESTRQASILISGFGMRNVDSFQRLIKMSHDEREKWQLRKLWRDSHGHSITSKKELRERASSSTASVTTETRSASKSSSDFEIQTESLHGDLRHLQYLLGLQTEEEEEETEAFKHFPQEEIEEIDEDDFKYSSSQAVKNAQRYLRAHRIFECFQFMVAHLLNANAEDPIEFILNLLNRCLLYRGRYGDPPLLYEKKHINKLFDLMDRMQSGCIDPRQYAVGMKTLGICTFNENPELDDDGLVTRETFVDEVYEAETAIFDEMIKARKEKKKAKKPLKDVDSVSVQSGRIPYFIPSELFKFDKKSSVRQDMTGE